MLNRIFKKILNLPFRIVMFVGLVLNDSKKVWRRIFFDFYYSQGRCYKHHYFGDIYRIHLVHFDDLGNYEYYMVPVKVKSQFEVPEGIVETEWGLIEYWVPLTKTERLLYE